MPDILRAKKVVQSVSVVARRRAFAAFWRHRPPTLAKMTDLLSLARAAQNHAYAPYSGFHIGAAIRLQNGEMFAGCNVENASYGATICAERGAILAAVAALGKVRVVEIVVVSEGNPPWPPCGMCRQVLAEFCAPDCVVHAVNAAGVTLSWRFDELFPSGFTPDFLDEPAEKSSHNP